ncbi:hypothetical protein HAX54_043614 [Datura stramonium]|uniref:Uncharacterized protein n=1 Tax=Datura stramonium TaxID=4076 RepID=A0ABS8W4Q8_DATST|nr:hypothetical protein [Datura stramonium]
MEREGEEERKWVLMEIRDLGKKGGGRSWLFLRETGGDLVVRREAERSGCYGGISSVSHDMLTGVERRRRSASGGSMVTAGEEDEGEGAVVFCFQQLVGVMSVREDRGEEMKRGGDVVVQWSADSERGERGRGGRSRWFRRPGD